MRTIRYTITCLSQLCVICLIAQKPYFQQETNYIIHVALDDENHTLQGTWELEYINHSPDTLHEIYLHLWPNAYKDNTTAFARQKLQLQNTKFHFAADEARGYITGLDFVTAGKKIEWAYDTEHSDIARLTLSAALLPGKSIHISSPFFVQIPEGFSRFGHSDQAYQITQWYPKPAVYDRNGWHAMPYLDMGEFYSEFGHFDISITLPANYVVAATGQLQTPEEHDFLAARARETQNKLESGFKANQDFPPSLPTFKTIRYTANKVHDFAWFADKRYNVIQGDEKLFTGKNVTTWIFFTNVQAHFWKHAGTYTSRALRFLSNAVGEYPYPQMSIVQGSLEAGSGMEYPMVTVIGNVRNADRLDQLIVHEIAHNWFYGALGFNERAYPWLDEGLTTYYEQRYLNLYHPDKNLRTVPILMSPKSEITVGELGFLLQAGRHNDQPACMHSEDMTAANYLLAGYARPVTSFALLENIITTDSFDRIIANFYTQWQFKHPGPQDFRTHWEKHYPNDISWLFDDMLCSTKKADYSIKNITKSTGGYSVEVHNHGNLAVPFSITGFQEDKAIYTEWYNGVLEGEILFFPKENCDQLIIDNQRLVPDINRRNNAMYTPDKKRKLNLGSIQMPRFLVGEISHKKSPLYFSPYGGWNNYDKLMLGVALYNKTAIDKKFEFALAPAFSFVSGKVQEDESTNINIRNLDTKFSIWQDLLGVGELRYNWYPISKRIHKFTLGVTGKTFSNAFNSLDRQAYYFKYRRWTPYLNIHFAKKPTDKIWQSVRLSSVFTRRQDIRYLSTNNFTIGTRKADYHRIVYNREHRTALSPSQFTAGLEFHSGRFRNRRLEYTKLTATWSQYFTYAYKKKIHLRMFGGAFLANNLRNRPSALPQAFAIAYQGFNDYAIDDFYFGRSEGRLRCFTSDCPETDVWGQQVHIRDGGMKHAFGAPYRNAIGHSNSYMVALNAKADIPFLRGIFAPIKPYADFVLYDAVPEGNSFLWSGGLMLEIGRDAFAVNFPLLHSAEIKNVYTGSPYHRRITFSLDLNKLHPWKIIERIDF